MLDLAINKVNNYERFEDCIAKIFAEAEYSIIQNVVLANNGDIDIVAEKDDRKYCVEVKYAQGSEKAIHQIRKKAKSNKMLPILVLIKLNFYI